MSSSVRRNQLNILLIYIKINNHKLGQHIRVRNVMGVGIGAIYIVNERILVGGLLGTSNIFLQ